MVKTQRKWTATVVALAAGVALLVALRLSAPFRHNFALQQKLSVFQRVISQLQDGPSPVPAALTKIPIPADARGDMYSIMAQQPADGHLAVEFLTSGWFPVKHRGFLFLSAGQLEDYPDMASRWLRREQLRDHWLYVGD